MILFLNSFINIEIKFLLGKVIDLKVLEGKRRLSEFRNSIFIFRI